MIAAAWTQLTTLYSLPDVGLECALAWAMTNAAEKPRTIDSAMLIMWWPPVFELPAAPQASVTPLPPKLSSGNSDPSAFHWKTMLLPQSYQMGALTMMSSSINTALFSRGDLLRTFGSSAT